MANKGTKSMVATLMAMALLIAAVYVVVLWQHSKPGVNSNNKDRTYVLKVTFTPTPHPGAVEIWWTIGQGKTHTESADTSPWGRPVVVKTGEIILLSARSNSLGGGPNRGTLTCSITREDARELASDSVRPNDNDVHCSVE